MNTKKLYYIVMSLAFILSMLTAITFAGLSVIGFFVLDKSILESLLYLALAIFGTWNSSELIKIMEYAE